MPMVHLGRLHVPVGQPLLQLTGASDLVRCEPRPRCRPSFLKIAIDPERLGRGGDVCEEVAQDLLIHGRAHGK
jgi:hypothetical protein